MSIRMLLVFLLVVSLPLFHASNVLIVGGSYGSHIYLCAAVADVLVDAGHNVTVLGVLGERNVDMSKRKFHWVTPATEADTAEEIASCNKMLEGLLPLPSEDMMLDILYGTDSADKRMRDFISSTYSYWTGEEFSRLMEEGRYDLVVAEDTAFGVGVKFIGPEIPVISLTATSDVKTARDRQGLPGLLNSEPNFLNVIEGNVPPTFYQRFQTFMRFARMMIFFIGAMVPIYADTIAESGHTFEDFNGFADVMFVSDHPALSFPYLQPPNLFYLGFFQLENRPLNPLPEHYENFIANCPYDDVAYMSFGSYVTKISIVNQTETLLKVISETKLCLILKTGEDVVDLYKLPPDRILQQTWVPQKDLLGSGKISFFVSHCGNNGRIESIYYNIPLLCIPLFGDQYHNARLVSRNQHGLFLLKEDVTEESFRNTLQNMLDNRVTFSENMRRSAETVKQDPTSGAEMLLFQAEYLMEHGNADYLKNALIKQQTTVEIYNLDIVMVVLVGVVGVLFGLYKFVMFLRRRVKKKQE